MLDATVLSVFANSQYNQRTSQLNNSSLFCLQIVFDIFLTTNRASSCLRITSDFNYKEPSDMKSDLTKTLNQVNPIQPVLFWWICGGGGGSILCPPSVSHLFVVQFAPNLTW